MDNIRYKSCYFSEISEFISSELLRRLGDLHGLRCVYAHEGVDMIGLCIIKPMTCTNAELKLLYVLDDYRRKGVATFLLQLAMKTWGMTLFMNYQISEKVQNDNFTVFFQKIGAQKVLLNGSVYVVSLREWLRHVLPVIVLYADKTPEFYTKKEMELDTEEWNKVVLAVQDNNLCSSLSPFEYTSANDMKLYFFKKTGDLIGWIIPTRKNLIEVSLSVTYILPEYRGGRWVFAFYRDATNFVVDNWPTIRKIHFQMDTLDYTLGHFYQRLLRYTQYNCLRKVRYEIPFVQTT